MPMRLQSKPAKTAANLQVTGPFDPIVGLVGGDVVLDCVLVTAATPENMEVRWINMEYGYNLPVHVYKNRTDDLTFQPSAYRGRTEMFFNEMAQGNLSLRLKDVRVSDRGQYKCFVASNDKHNNIKVTLDVTGTGPQPWIKMEVYVHNGITLGCMSEGWYPQPPILWLNGDGENVTAQQQITYQPDAQELLTVSSFIKISKQSTNKYTCIINNVMLKERQEAHIQITDAFFQECKLTSPFWIIITMLALLALTSCVFLALRIKAMKRASQRQRKNVELK
ncbi:butyrophilin subfamily 2 member A2-like isoform X2 [Stegostoma tigrinum]|uniref:butyrophilin subfamily 2 member A2-like isoform X2 n=1 Tax=Stegostoma tigrinum TaxID=3053191 RepID=UPI00202B8F5A|nr:butyrophilin subfamily 2 member A2-like isoform X2 [Stegostoma tigrinum]